MVQLAQGTYKTKSAFDRKNRAARGWELYVKRKDGSGDWVAIKDLMDSYSVPLADYEM